MKKIFAFSIILFFTFTLFSVNSFAQATTADAGIASTVTSALKTVSSSSVLPQALSWLASFMGLQFVITNLGLLKSGADINAVFAKLIGSLVWFGFCFYVINHGPQFIDTVGTAILTKFFASIPTVGQMLTTGVAICAVLAAAAFAVGLFSTTIGMLLVYLTLIIFGFSLYMAIKVFMISLELGLIVMLSPLAFSFLGLNALKDQGIAPFKSLIALIYRIIVLGIVCGAFVTMTAEVIPILKAVSWSPGSWDTAIGSLFGVVCGYPILAFLAYKSDSIAASLAGGGSTLGTGDVASAAAAGAAAGAFLASGGAAAGATKIPQSMGNFMQNLMGGGGSVSNATTGGGAGGGGSPSALPTMPDTSQNPESSRPGQAASSLASVSGASAEATAAGVKTAGSGGSPSQIHDAVVKAGGTPEQGKAISTAAGGGDGLDKKSYLAAVAANPNRTSVASTSPMRPDQSSGGPTTGGQTSTSGQENNASMQENPNTPASIQDIGQPSAGNIGPNSTPTTSLPAGSGANAGIAGGQGDDMKKMGAALEMLAKQGQRKKTTGDHLSTLGQHVAQEKAHVSVSINTNHQD